MSARPKMQSIWNEVVSLEADRYEGTISEILFNSRAINDRYAPIRTVGTLEIFVAVFPFDENDNQSEIIHRKVTAEGAYVFGRFTRDFLVGHTLKRVDIYPDIIRFDIVTIGALLSFECDSYRIVTLSEEK